MLTQQPGELRRERYVPDRRGDRARRMEDTNWRELAALYGLLERLTGNPIVSLNRAIAVAMVDGPSAGLSLLEPLRDRAVLVVCALVGREERSGRR